MKSELEQYMETGILGSYIPERVIGRKAEDTVMPVFRDAVYIENESSVELQRSMTVGGRRFLVRSIFSAEEKAKTPTERMLQIIDNDLENGSI